MMIVLCYCVILVLLVLPLCSSSSVIIVEDAKVCFKRALAGKRVSRSFVRKVVSCERVEDCQQECSDEKRFACEGFNYRLDPTGRGRGDCELIDIPFVLLDLHRDVIPNSDYDYYEKDRNTFRRCKNDGLISRPVGRPYYSDHHQLPPPGNWPNGGEYGRYGEDRYGDTHRHDDYHREPRPGFVFRLPPPDDYRPYNRRSDTFHMHRKHPYQGKPNFVDGDRFHASSHPPLDYDRKLYLPPRNRIDYSKKHTSVGGYENFGKTPSYEQHVGITYDNEVPLPFNSHKRWGEYGGVYGTGGYHMKTDQDYWDLNKHDGNDISVYDIGVGFPATKPSLPDYYLPVNAIPPHNNGYPKDATPTNLNVCSLRAATGYRLYNKVVKKILSVSSIYDCESACFRETEFVCTSYAFRYIIGSGVPPNNCYLSNRNYKELDYYTDLEQDKNFDIYTMNNKDSCGGAAPHQWDSSECFLHVRSGQRLDDTCVRASLYVKSFVDCELECLRAGRFICRTFTFRYGSPIIGDVAENCQLSDAPFRELIPHRDLIPDPSFVLHERASYGYGCELDYANGPYLPKPSMTSEADKVCYVSYGWPAKLLHQASKRILKVPTEEDCKAECTRARMETSFSCMSLSFKSIGLNEEPNCFLSDIFQRDLLETVDYVRVPDYWLFSWDSTHPKCHFPNYYEQRVPFENRNSLTPGLITWRIYSVGGWPCRRGTLCRQSEVGFWFCELEGGSPSAWDYCCRPLHQCGYSEGFAYQWCYVGPSSTQWRKCSDKYYPYLPSPQLPDYSTSLTPPTTYLPYHSNIPSTTISDFHTKPPLYSVDLHTDPPTSSIYVPTPSVFIEEPKKTYLPPNREPRPWPTEKPISAPYRSGFRPDRPKAPISELPPKQSLNEYEQQFDNIFLDPPKPGGFGQPRLWPISYLHKETPPNASSPTTQKFEQMKLAKESGLEPKYEAIKSLINIIKSNDLNNIKYQISNESNRADDVLHVQIPLPSNFTDKLERRSDEPTELELLPPKEITRVHNRIEKNGNKTSTAIVDEKQLVSRSLPVYRRSYIEKTNVTNVSPWKIQERLFNS